MLKTYFFIPANNKRFISKAKTISADNFIYDLEDSITKHELEASLDNLKKIEISDSDFVRPNLNIVQGKLDTKLLNNLKDIGFKNFVIPKIRNIAQLEIIQEAFGITHQNFKQFSFVLLIEHPAALVNLNEIIKSKLLNIIAIGLGNHDYTNEMGMKPFFENLFFARHTILNISKAYDIEAIDIVSLDLNADEEFKEEVLDGFQMGFDAKFVIHPSQIQKINEVKYYSDEEIEEAERVYPHIADILEEKISLIKLDGKIYEKPHIERISKIIKWINR